MRPNFLDEYEFFTGVPDSLLSPFCNYLMEKYGLGEHHIIAANEGNAVGLAAGYHLATGKVPVVYLQNSGIGNIINPVVSLLNDKVYGIPVIFVVGWRGEPGRHDEPQHVYQGAVTLQLLKDTGIEPYVISDTTTEEEVRRQKELFAVRLAQGKSVAWVARSGAFTAQYKYHAQSAYAVRREEILDQIIAVTKDDVIVSTTGKTSRELFELREKNGQSHQQDFLTVGSMGHSSSIALSLALKRPERKVWCIDGDGAALMHLGSMATIAAYAPKNMVHIVINNESHESVGGLPTVTKGMDLVQVARGCGYPHAEIVQDLDSLRVTLERIAVRRQLAFLEIKAAIGSRKDLGRPTTTTWENKVALMRYLQTE